MNIIKNNLFTIFKIIIMVFLMIFILFPIIYSFIFSGFNQYEENASNNTKLIPNKWTFDNYKMAFQSGYLNSLIFSFIFALLLIFFRLIVCGSAGYVLSKKKLKLNKIFIIFFAFLSAIPENALFLGLISKINDWNMNEGILLFIGLSGPNIFSLFIILLFRNSFLSIKSEEIKLMKIDKLNFWQKLAVIFLPKLKITIILTVVITGSAAWNSYLWPMVILPPNQNTLSTWVFSLGNMPDATTSYAMKLAGVALYTLPIIIIYSIFHKKIIKSINNI